MTDADALRPAFREPGPAHAIEPGPGTDSRPAPAYSGLAARPWGLDSRALRELHRALRFDHFKWDSFSAGRFTLLPECLVVPEPLHRRVVEAVESLNVGLARFENRVFGQPDALERLGIPRPLHPLIAEEPERPHQCARYDLFPCDDGRLMVSEFNEDVPGGFNEAEALPLLLGDPGPGCRWESGLRQHLVDAFRGVDGVALLYATAFSEDLQHMLILDRWLSAAGHRTVRASPAHLRRGWFGGARVLRHAVDAAFRFYPGEWLPRLPNFEAWRRLNPGLAMMNPLRRLIRQSKKVFELWWEDAAGDRQARALLQAHAPRTYAFDPAEAGRLEAEQPEWVLKRVFGRMGDAVIMGSLVDGNTWRDSLRAAALEPMQWCVQRRFQVVPLRFEAGPLFPALGAYVVNGRFAGYYSRAAARPFLTHEAFHVATVVQVS